MENNNEHDRRVQATNALIAKQTAAIIRNARMTMLCNECGKKFKAASLNGRCPKCRGCDFEPTF